MRKLFVAGMIAFAVAGNAMAHDEGHGPKLADTGKFGGLVSAVVLKSEADKGPSAKLLNKSELVRSADGTARVYLYDTKMAALDLAVFEPKASAIVITKVKGKNKVTPFALEVKDGAFVGKMPKVASKPYDIDVTIKKDKQELLTAFDNLD